MKVFFTASYRGKQTHQKIYDLVIDTLKTLDVEIISKELQDYDQFISAELINTLPEDKIHYLYMKKAIETCDLGIMEVSTSSFLLGHEATLILSKQKPLLLLSDHEIYNLNLTYQNVTSQVYKTKRHVKHAINNFINSAKKNLLKDEKPNTDIKIGEKIRQYRERYNMSQLDLEFVIGSQSGHMSRVENGTINPTKETIFKIASALEFSREETFSLIAE